MTGCMTGIASLAAVDSARWAALPVRAGMRGRSLRAESGVDKEWAGLGDGEGVVIEVIVLDSDGEYEREGVCVLVELDV